MNIYFLNNKKTLKLKINKLPDLPYLDSKTLIHHKCFKNRNFSLQFLPHLHYTFTHIYRKFQVQTINFAFSAKLTKNPKTHFGF